MNLINNEQFYIGAPAEIPNLCFIYPKTLREIATIGVKNFYSYLNFFTLSNDDIQDYLAQINAQVKELTVFQFHLVNSQDKEYANSLTEAFKFFLKEESITILLENEAIVLGDIKENRIIHEEEFKTICSVIKAQNNADADDGNEEKNTAADARAAQIMKKIKEGKKAVNKAKQSDLSFTDLVASLAAKGNGLNALNVWDLTYYAFNDQFKRMQWIEEYENALKALLAGAKKESVQLNHWIRSMDKENKK